MRLPARTQELKDMFQTIANLLWHDKHDGVREAAAHYLGILGPAVPLTLGHRQAQACLVDALSDPMVNVR